MDKDFLDANKIMYHSDRLVAWLKDEYRDIYPVTVELHISGRCNNNCYYCFDKSNKSGKLMTEDDAFSIIDKLKNMGVRSIVLSGGGEPTMNKDAGGIIQYIRHVDIEVGLITNGVSMSSELIDTIVNCCTWVRVSYDSTNPDTYKKIRKTDNASDVFFNLKKLGERAKECTVGAQIVVNDYNLYDLQNTANDLSGIGLNYLQIRPLENIEYGGVAINHIKAQLKILKKTYGDWLILPQKWELIDQDRGYDRCWCYPFIGTITVDGEIYICCHHINDRKYYYGNLLNDDIPKIINKREIVAKNIHLEDCPKLCRGNSINTTLEKVKQGIAHVNFL